MLCLRALLLFSFPLYLSAQLTTHLLPETDQAFDRYIETAESKMDWQPRFPSGPSQLTITPYSSHADVDVKGGVIHDWVAATVVSGATIDKVLAILQSYDDYKRLYSPQVTDSKLLSHEGNHWHAYLKLYKKKVLTANLDSEYDIDYKPLGEEKWTIISHSTKISEIDDGRALPPGTGHGFLWRLNAYWILEQRLDGLYLECRAISLSRDIPTGLGWLIKPMLTSVPRDSLRETIESTIRALHGE